MARVGACAGPVTTPVTSPPARTYADSLDGDSLGRSPTPQGTFAHMRLLSPKGRFAWWDARSGWAQALTCDPHYSRTVGVPRFAA